MNSEAQTQLTIALLQFFAHRFGCNMDELQINIDWQSNTIHGIYQDPDQTFDLNTNDVLQELLIAMFAEDGIRIIEGFKPIFWLHREDIQYYDTVWLSSKLKDDDISIIAQELNHDSFYDTLETNIDYVLQERFAELYDAPQREKERELIYLFRHNQYYAYQDLSDSEFVSIIDTHHNECTNDIARAVIDAVQTKYPDENIDETASFLEKLRFEDFRSDVLQFAQNKNQVANFLYQHPMLQELFGKGYTVEQCYDTICGYLKVEEAMTKEFKLLVDIFARDGQNILPIQALLTNEIQAFIREAAVQSKPVIDTFEAIISYACERHPKLAEIDTAFIAYQSKSFNDILAVRNNSQDLSSLPAVDINNSSAAGHHSHLYYCDYTGKLLKVIVRPTLSYELGIESFLNFNPLNFDSQLVAALSELAQIKESPRIEWNHYDPIEHPLSIAAAAQTLPYDVVTLRQYINDALQSSLNFIFDEYQVAVGEDKSHWTDLLDCIFKAQAALHQLNH